MHKVIFDIEIDFESQLLLILDQVNTIPTKKIFSLFKFWAKKHLVGRATLCAKSEVMLIFLLLYLITSKSLSEVLLFAEHGENMLCTKIVLNVGNNFCTQHFLPRFELGIFMYWTCNSMNNLSSYCGLVDAKIRASDKDLPRV